MDTQTSQVWRYNQKQENVKNNFHYGMDNNRDNKSWVDHLSSKGREQQEALSELRGLLIRSLHGAISQRSHIDESFLEDAVQDALVLILDKLDQFEGRSRFLTWATSIAIRVSMSKLRRKQWKEVSLDQLIINDHFAFEESDGDVDSEPESDWERKNILQKMHTIIQNELTEKQRIALLSELKGVPQDDIARHLGSSRNALYKLTHDARKRLKQGLEAAGYSAVDVNVAFTT